MKVIGTKLPSAFVIEPQVFEDARGFFYESYNRDKYHAAGLTAEFVQSNVSRSSKGALRGLHYQWPFPQGKLVSVLEGEVFDVAVDIRQDSPTFGRWEAVMLTGENHRHFWIPEGFAHGFCVLSEHAVFTYQCTAPYNSTTDASIRWDDTDIGIDWPLAHPILSEKDARAPYLRNIAAERLPRLPS